MMDTHDDYDNARMRDEVVKRMLATPPKPREKPMPGGKRGRPIAS